MSVKDVCRIKYLRGGAEKSATPRRGAFLSTTAQKKHRASSVDQLMPQAESTKNAAVPIKARSPLGDRQCDPKENL